RDPRHPPWKVSGKSADDHDDGQDEDEDGADATMVEEDARPGGISPEDREDPGARRRELDDDEPQHQPRADQINPLRQASRVQRDPQRRGRIENLTDSCHYSSP